MMKLLFIKIYQKGQNQFFIVRDKDLTHCYIFNCNLKSSRAVELSQPDYNKICKVQRKLCYLCKYPALGTSYKVQSKLNTNHEQFVIMFYDKLIKPEKFQRAFVVI